MRAAWDLAVDARQHSLAEYIFEKLKPFVSAEGFLESRSVRQVVADCWKNSVSRAKPSKTWLR